MRKSRSLSLTRGLSGLNVSPYYFAVDQDIIYEKDGEWRSGFELPEVQEAFKFYVDLVTEYGVKDPGTLAWGFAEAARAWEEEALTMINIGEWFRDVMIGDFGEDWDIMLFPVKEGNDPFVFSQQVYWHISEQSDHKDAAWQFIDYLMEPERNAELGHLDTDSPPADKMSLAEPYWADNEFVNTRIATWGPYASFMNPHPKYTEIWDSVVGPVTHDAIQGRVTTDEAIEILNAEINKILGVE
jgi:ABC-type glycerol-3-phosphate transport system substrate-binding protein